MTRFVPKWKKFQFMVYTILIKKSKRWSKFLDLLIGNIHIQCEFPKDHTTFLSEPPK